MHGDYYIRHGGRTQGPFSVEKLHEMARRGRFSRACQVSADQIIWQRASELPDLFPQAAPPRGPRSAPVGSGQDVTSSGEPPLPESGETNEDDSYNLEGILTPEPVAGGALWYFTINDEDQPPVTLDELESRVRQGHLRANDEVWTEGFSDWREASGVPELSPLFPEMAVSGSDPVSFEPAGIPASGSVRASAAPTAPMAVASLVLGLLGTSLLYLFGSILAVVFGHIALRQIKESEGRIGGHGLAVTGLIFGYAVIIVTVVAGIVFLLAILLGFAAVAGGAAGV